MDLKTTTTTTQQPTRATSKTEIVPRVHEELKKTFLIFILKMLVAPPPHVVKYDGSLSIEPEPFGSVGSSLVRASQLPHNRFKGREIVPWLRQPLRGPFACVRAVEGFPRGCLPFSRAHFSSRCSRVSPLSTEFQRHSRPRSACRQSPAPRTLIFL